MRNMDEKIEHESFAVLQINRVSGEGGNLFGSSIQHRHFIELNITSAYIHRNLNCDFIHSKGIPHITIRMSNSQFAEAITSMNMGSGTPVTIKSLIGKDGYKTYEEPPLENKRMQFDNEFEKSMGDLGKKLRIYKLEIEDISRSMSKKSQDNIKARLDSLFQDIESNIPFIKKQFTEQMDKTSLEAKGEVEGFFLTKIYKLGLKKLKLDDVLKIGED